MSAKITPQITAMHDAVYDLLLSNINDSPTSGEATNARAVMNATMDELCGVVSPFKAMKMLHNVIASFDDEIFCFVSKDGDQMGSIKGDKSEVVSLFQDHRKTCVVLGDCPLMVGVF